MKILAIDTSCDDTSVAIAENLCILANVFWSKLKTYAKWGGVVPSEAKRQHKEFLDPAIKAVLEETKLKLSDIDVIAVTQGPGLAIALEAGIQKAKEITESYEIPLVAVNHMVGHVYSNLTRDQNGNPYSGLKKFSFPILALAISGGHTDLYLITQHLQFQLLGHTLDDAVGEAFDKVGRMLGMSFPAGAKIEEVAKNGTYTSYNFPRPLIHQDNYNFSYSGLKTAVLYQIRRIVGDYESKPHKGTFKLEDASKELSQTQVCDIATSFQQAAFDVLVATVKAIKKYKPTALVVGGGVIANHTLRLQLKKALEELKTVLYYPKPLWLCTDNAAMIATAAYFYAKQGKFIKNIENLDRKPNMPVD